MHGDNEDETGPLRRRSRGRPAKTPKLPKSVAGAVQRRARQEGDRHRRPRPAEGRRLHRLLRDLHRHQPAADSRDCRRRRRHAAEGARRAAGRWRKASTSRNGSCSTTSTSSCTSSAASAAPSTASSGSGATPSASSLPTNRRRAARRHPGAALRRLLPCSRLASVRPRLRRVLGRRHATARPLLPHLRRSASIMASDQRRPRALPALPPHARLCRRRAIRRPLRRFAPRDHSCVQVRRPPRARRPACGHDADGRRRNPHGRRCGRPGAAPSVAADAAWIQPGRRSRPASGPAGHPGVMAGSCDDAAGGALGGGPPAQHPRRVPAVAVCERSTAPCRSWKIVWSCSSMTSGQRARRSTRARRC